MQGLDFFMLVLDLLLELLDKQDDSLVSHGEKNFFWSGPGDGRQAGRQFILWLKALAPMSMGH